MVLSDQNDRISTKKWEIKGYNLQQWVYPTAIKIVKTCSQSEPVDEFEGRTWPPLTFLQHPLW